MIAGLKGNINGGTGTGTIDIGNGIDLGVGGSGSAVPALAKDPVIPDNDSPDTGVGCGSALPFFSLGKGKTHVFAV
jgi:hypothetical protein